ncbi:MAG TPA: NTF2-like N-terminal transpeptidase domain-containing protein [Candidatus Hydromicrobium sp.]
MLKKKFYILFFLLLTIIIVLPACRSYDGKFDITYFFKTEPEKAVLDFFQSLDNKDADFIYTNLLPDKDKNNISKEKYVNEFENILSDIVNIDVNRTVYLGYENDMSKVVAEFEVSYKNGEAKQYKRYIYLVEESGKWKIIFEKTFI